jgi:hypothetical protein
LAGGHKSSDKGYFVEPTVQVNTREDMKVVQEETFGPVVVAMPFSDPAELVPSANDNVYGLAAGIWTRDISKPTAWPTKSLPEPSGSTAATSSTLPCPSVATSNPDGARNGSRGPQQLHADESGVRENLAGTTT